MGAEMFNPVVALACHGFQTEWKLKEHIFHILEFIYLQFMRNFGFRVWLVL
jgi:hypothetical protein